VRLNSTQTPQGVFGARGPSAYNSTIGYDLGVCVEAVEPWIVEAYNTTSSSPATISLVGRGNTVYGTDSHNLRDLKKHNDADIKFADVDAMNVHLNSTGKLAAWIAAHENSRNMLIKDSSTDFYYSVSPTTVALTGGRGPLGYTQLSPEAVEITIASADASHLLPYLSGSQLLLAHSYQDKTLAYSRVSLPFLLAALSVILVAGLVGGFFVPKLPFGLPRRDLGVLSIVAAIEGDKLFGPLTGMVDQNMTLDDLHRELGDVAVRYPI